MSRSKINSANGNAETYPQKIEGQWPSLSSLVEPEYQPAFNRVELTEIRAPFWGIANNAMQEYFEGNH